MSEVSVVLVGGGHAHVEVVRDFGLRPAPSWRLTLVSREPHFLYSGMLPGLVAGHYRRDECHVDLPRLCRAAGVRFVHAEAHGLDRGTRHVFLHGAPPLRYDILSLDVGITPRLDEIKGAEANALVVKPISSFVPKWEALLASCRQSGGPRRFVAVGGGAAGFELILAVRHHLLAEVRAAGSDPSALSFALVTAGRLLEEHNRQVQRAGRRALSRAGVRLVENSKAVAIGASGVSLEAGNGIEADAVLVSTAASAPDWLRASGLRLDERGFVAIGPTLQSLNDADVSAVGDCATMIGAPRPKAGVFAVRQGPILAANLRRRANGSPLEGYAPQERWLSLISTGDRYAIAGRGWLKAEGRWVWRWKDWIDRRWIGRYATPDTSRR